MQTLDYHITDIDEDTRLADYGDFMILEQLEECGKLNSVHVSPSQAVAIAAAIMSRLNA